MNAIFAYISYLTISIGITVWVTRTFNRHGHPFTANRLGGDGLGDSLIRMLVVGFNLVNIGYIALSMKTEDRLDDIQQVIEYLGTKIGTVMLVLAVTHFFILYVISRPRSWEPAESERHYPDMV